jgi:hypothetical protein
MTRSWNSDNEMAIEGARQIRGREPFRGIYAKRFSRIQLVQSFPKEHGETGPQLARPSSSAVASFPMMFVLPNDVCPSRRVSEAIVSRKIYVLGSRRPQRLHRGGHWIGEEDGVNPLYDIA